MTYPRIFLVYLFIQVTNVSTGGSPTHLGISLKLNIKHRNKDSQICNTPACHKTAELLVKYVDFKTDPCEDFYQFSCGNFIKEMPPGKTRVGSLVNIKVNLMQNLKGILEELPSEAKDNFEKQTKMSFQSCIDTTAIDNGGVKALKEVLKKFGGWPLVEGDKWKEEECNLTAIFTKYQLHGMLSIFQVITSDIFRIMPAYSPNDPYKANSTILGIYKQYVLNASLYLGEMEKSDNFVKAVDDIVDFGKSLSECLPTFSQRPKINATNTEILKKIFEKTFDIESLLKSFYKNAGFDLLPSEIIGMTHPPYFTCLAQLLEVTSKRTIVNYLVWNMIKRSVSAMPNHFVQFSSNFNSELGSKNILRWESCINLITELLDKALCHLYAIRHFSQTSKKKILDQLQRIKNSFKGLIANENWLTEDSKVAMIAKIEQMKDNIGYPDPIYDPRFIDGDFDGVDFSGQSFLEIFLAINMMKVKDKLKIMKNPDLTIMPVTFINAFHYEYRNEIAFSVAILSPPYYSESFPASLNFGGTGITMGHEITHALGMLGHKVVLNGVARELWEGETRENFLKRSECLINQFNGIPTETNIKLNGTLTKVENIADAGGLRIAYMALKRWLNENGEEKQLPGFPYTSEQMFFINYGASFCRRHTNVDPEYEPNDNHPPHKIRVNMSLKNFKTFSKVFKCKSNSEMNLSERCKVW